MKLFLVPIICALYSIQGFSQIKSRYIPEYYALQYAGSIGTLSIGAGYDLWKNKGLLSFHYGYVPRSLGGDLNIVASKFSYKCWTFKYQPNTQINLFTVGAMISYHIGEQFHSRWPSRYPRDYYWWRPSLRVHLLIENSIDISLRRGPVKLLTAYVEANANELYLASFAGNLRTLSLGDIFKLGIGVRVHFRSKHANNQLAVEGISE
jgi:hypothetical protein